MSSQNYAVQFSFKTPGGTLINVPVSDLHQAAAILDGLPGLLPKVAGVESVFAAASNVGQAGAAAPPQQQAPPPPADPWGAAGAQPQQQGWGAQQQTAQNGSPRTCEHGPYVWKDFVSKAGNPVKGWFCPSNQRTNCEPEFRK